MTSYPSYETKQNKIEIKDFESKYVKTNTILGAGNFSYVQSGYTIRYKRKIVIKIIFKEQYCKLKEALLLKKLSHPNIIQYLNHYHISKNIYYLVMSYFGQMNLLTFIKQNHNITEIMSHKIFVQVYEAIAYCKQKHILHRDIQCRNVRINTLTHKIKLVDFGSAVLYHNGFYFLSIKNSNLNAPPEWFHLKKYTASSLTVWTLGILLYTLTFNKKPFKKTFQISHFPCFYPKKKKLSINLVMFLKWCFAKQINSRMSMAEMKHHPWITKIWP